MVFIYIFVFEKIKKSEWSLKLVSPKYTFFGPMPIPGPQPDTASQPLLNQSINQTN